MSKPSDLVQGTLDLLDPQDGRRRAAATAGRLPSGFARRAATSCRSRKGSLYPALHRLEQQGWLKASWIATETGREAKVYALTAAGRRQLAKELESWHRLSTAIGLVVQPA